MNIECLLNPGVFRFDGKIWLLLRVAERPEQKPGMTSFPVLNAQGPWRSWNSIIPIHNWTFSTPV